MNTWKFTAYNGTQFVSDKINLFEAIDEFCAKFNLSVIDIWKIENLH